MFTVFKWLKSSDVQNEELQNIDLVQMFQDRNIKTI